ncbi:MAG: winged helix DNA-binding domain-containing protein [Actinobacteria bacterium]|nr:MAG: winged helix DNA-binding domain-containing protein [Actinomycetota bacterium]
MPRNNVLTDDEVRRRRSAAQLLHRPKRRSAADLVRHLTGMQSQSLPAARLAFPARTDGLTAERVDRARLRDRSIVHTWAMRGTLYLIAAEDYGWLVPLVIEPRIPNAFRRLEQEGVPADQPDKAVRLIGRMLGREGPLTRPQIAERLRSKGIHTKGQALVHLLWLASAKGVICRGPERGRDQCFVLVRDWIGEPEPMARDAALAELAVRFLKAHGPSTPADLAMWSGIRAGDARRAWAGIEDRLVEVETARGATWSLRRSAAEAPRGVVRLIPWWDEYLLGWKDRDLVAPPHQWRKINRDGGGWLNPTILADGQAVGMWNTEQTPKALHVEVQSFSPLSPMVRRGVRREAEALSGFLATPVKPVFAGGPSRRRVARRARPPGASAPPPGSSPRPNP